MPALDIAGVWALRQSVAGACGGRPPVNVVRGRRAREWSRSASREQLLIAIMSVKAIRGDFERKAEHGAVHRCAAALPASQPALRPHEALPSYLVVIVSRDSGSLRTHKYQSPLVMAGLFEHSVTARLTCKTTKFEDLDGVPDMKLPTKTEKRREDPAASAKPSRPETPPSRLISSAMTN